MAEEGIPTVQARVAEWMGMSRASVSEHVKRLIRDGLLEAEGRTLSSRPRARPSRARWSAATGSPSTS